MLDANESWSRKQAVRHVGELERTLDLTWIEEPVRRWDADGLAAVSRGVRASVASGENLTGLEQFRPLIAAGGVDIVQTAAVWGVTHFLRVAALAHAYDLPVSPIGNTPVALLHAATSVPNHLASELQDLQPPIGVAIDLHVEDGAFVLGDTPGLGIRIDEDGDDRGASADGTRTRRTARTARAGRPAAARRRPWTSPIHRGQDVRHRGDGGPMKAVVYRGARHPRDREPGRRGADPGQVAIEVAYTGICGTDLHIYHGDMDARVGAAAVIGHEMSGRVAAVGAGVDRLVRRPSRSR